MAMTTRQRLAQQREERPKPCRPTEEESRSETETDRAEGVPFREHKRKRCGKEIDLSWFDKARLRVIAAAVFGFRCLLTLEPGLTNKDLNFVHFLARTTAIIILLCLEHAWGLYPGHLNVNHYLNVDIMRMDLHHSFDAGIFFFLPTTAVLRKILEFTEFNTSKSRTRDKKKFYEEFTDTTWTYNFYAVSFDQNRSIHRRNIDTSVRIPDITRHPDKGGYTEHTFPFNHEDMKNIQSHVHPFFATANVYLHMLKLSRKERERMICENEALQLVWKIGQIWLQPVPPSFKDTRKGGANAMADPERDTESFLADKDSQGKIKYQKKEVFYRRLMDWADNQRSMENVFSKRPSPVVPSSPAPLEVSTRRRTRLSTVSLRQQDEDVAVEDTSSVRSAKRKRDDDHLEGPAGKKAAKTDSYPSPPPTRRSTRTGTKSSPTETFNLKPAIASYPTSLVSEVEDGRDLLLDFISSQISILRKSCKNVPKSSIDDQEIADIAFEVFESQSASLDGQMSIDIESDLAPMVKIPVGPPRAAKPKSLPIKKSDSSLSLISPMRPRSSTMTLAHVEIPVALSQSLSLRPAARGSSVAPSAPSSLKPRFERFTRAASTPPVIKRSSSKLLIKSPSVPRIGDIEVKPKPHSTPTNDLKRSSSPTIPLRTPDPGDDSIFLRAGQQMVFASLSKEFGLTVDEVSGVYDELGDLEKTKRVLARLCRSGPSSGLGMISSASQEAPSRVVKSASSPVRKVSVSRSRSLAPSSSRDSLGFRAPSTTPTRLFLKGKGRSTESSPALHLGGDSDSDNDTDNSDSLAWKCRDTKRGELGARRINKSLLPKSVIQREVRTPESRLDSLTRSIEMILTGGSTYGKSNVDLY